MVTSTREKAHQKSIRLDLSAKYGACALGMLQKQPHVQSFLVATMLPMPVTIKCNKKKVLSVASASM
jgi:hypothetical protein